MIIVWIFTGVLLVLGVAALLLSARSKAERASRVLESAGVAVVTASLLTGGAMLISSHLSEEAGIEATRADNARLVREAILSGATELPLGGLDLTGRELEQLELRGVDLSYAVLDRANLSYSNLGCARSIEFDAETAHIGHWDGCSDLNHLSAIDANLDRVSMRGANLTGASFQGAELSSASFEQVDASLSDFSDSNLFMADLTWGIFTGANFSGANLSFATMEGAELSNICYDEKTDWPLDFQPPKSACPEDGWVPPSDSRYR